MAGSHVFHVNDVASDRLAFKVGINEYTGTVSGLYRSLQYVVSLDNVDSSSNEYLCSLSGKLQLNRSYPKPGDKVLVEVSMNEGRYGRISKIFK